MKLIWSKSALFGLTVAAFLSITTAAPRAEACGGGGSGDEMRFLLVVASPVLAVNTGFTIHDVMVERSSNTYGFFEFLFTAPQALFGMMMLSQYANGDDWITPVVLGYTLWSGALAVHGLYALGSDTPKRESKPLLPRGQSGSPRVSITPAVVGDGMHKGMGLGLVGSF